jgi:hypothetical protein
MQRTYYVRAYPVDSLGNSIGDAGSGLPVIYGDPSPAKKESSGKVYLPIYLKLARIPGPVTYDGEFPNSFMSNTIGEMKAAGMYKTYSVLPSGYPSNTQELRVQVSLQNYVNSESSWQDAPGIVYEKSIFPDDPVFIGLKDLKTNGIEIDFSKFVPSDDKLPTDKNIPYYIRVVSFIKGSEPGTLKALYSQTATVTYGKFSPQATNLFLEQIKINPFIPEVTGFSYTPIQWEAENWEYHYEVFRQPSLKDVFGSLFSNDPYKPYAVGTILDLTPQPENKSWWEEAWDSITSFFSDLASFIAKIVNWVSTAYEDLKMGIIKLAVSAFPESWRGPMEKAIKAMVDYGLASIGIPPTLPNFDELSEMGVDYLATVAMETAGIPANDLTEYGVDKLSGDISDSVSSSARKSTPNPMDWTFVKHYQKDLYRPAYIMIELHNPSMTEATPEGMLYCKVSKIIDTTKLESDSNIKRIYSAYGSPMVYLYKPVIGMKIPALEPDQYMTVPIFLEEIVGVPFFSGGPSVIPSDFNIMYGGLGQFDFDIGISYKLPSVAEEAKKQGYTKDAIYSYSTLGNFFAFSIMPGQSYNK